MAVQYLLMLATVLLETVKNVFSNSFSKTSLKSNMDVYKFDAFGGFRDIHGDCQCGEPVPHRCEAQCDFFPLPTEAF